MKRHLSRRILLAVGLALLALLAFARTASPGEARFLSDDPTLLSHTVSAGEYHNCGVRTDGTLACWGKNEYGQAAAPTGTFTQVTAGRWHTCGVMTDGTLACWGHNGWGQAVPPAGTFSQVSAGYWHNCALMTDGTVACWGQDGNGEATPPAGTFTQVSAGWYHTCGVRTDGTLACWGKNEYGQATPPAGTFSQVSAGSEHNCGVSTDGSPACWGMDNYGQATPPAGTFSQVSAGTYHTCGVKTDGTLACWGRNDYGQATPPSGTIVIMKATDPAGGSGFGFTDNIAAPNAFSLDHGGTETFSNVDAFDAGSYTVIEDDPQVTPGGFALSDLTCTDPDGGSSVDLGARKATIDLDAGETVTCTFTNTAECVFPSDADCDACYDIREPDLSPPADPADPWDWYDVPVPTLFSGGHISGDPSGTDDRDHAITIIDDLLAVLEYAGTSDEGLPNAGPDGIPGTADDRDYDQDINGDGVDDGRAYDRSVGATRSAAPDGAVTIIDDVLLVLAQCGYSCGPAP